MKLIASLAVAFLLVRLVRSNIKNNDSSNELGPLIESNPNRTFIVDWDNDRFLKDGKPFRFIAGSLHYFRSHPDTWQRKLRTMRAAGLNAVTTYVEWSLHNPKDGAYIWDGIADLVQFIKYAAAEDLYVILRPGPYICAERDMGGFPYWLLSKYPLIELRTADTDYLKEVGIWLSKLMPLIEPLLYGNGGPIIMVQVENEYGSFYACDMKYRNWLKKEIERYVRNNAVLFTNDGPSVVSCGHIEGVLATLDFGSAKNVTEYWTMLRKLQPNGPLVNAEFYPGWLTHWKEKMQRVRFNTFKQTFIEMLEQGASVNFYMFHGGTNFGFTAGANTNGPGGYVADITSYDYDAPMDEAGDPTNKYFQIREVIKNYLPLPNIPIPEPLPKKKYGKIYMKACCSILSSKGRRILSVGSAFSKRPLSFETLYQFSGLLLYETDLPQAILNQSILKVENLHDRAYVYVDRKFIGILSRESRIYSLHLNVNSGKKLQILVENQGRINFEIANDFKGILGDVLIDKTVVFNWNMTKFPLEVYSDINTMIEESKQSSKQKNHSRYSTRSGPVIFYGELNILKDNVSDTYLDPSGWGKGIAFVNGINIGRYWPAVGPQITLYVPKQFLKSESNQIVMIEYERVPDSSEIMFTDVPRLDGK